MSNRPRNQDTISYEMGDNDDDEQTMHRATSLPPRERGILSLLFSYRLTIFVVIILAVNFYYLSLVTKSTEQLGALHYQIGNLTEQVAKFEADQIQRIYQLGLLDEKISNRNYYKTENLFTALSLHQNASTDPSSSSSSSASSSCIKKDFVKLGLEYGTDKMTTHIYHKHYKHYIEGRQCEPIKMLEIGLGCNMGYGPGASLYLWLDYFPNADIHIIEFDAECAKKFIGYNKRSHIYIGDQSNVTFLQEVMSQAGGDFDFIIDDGGHSMKMQITSLLTLFPAIKTEGPNGERGGVYIIEDLLTSYMPEYFDYGGPQNTTVNFIKEMVDDLMSRRSKILPHYKHDIVKEISRIDCGDEICAFSKIPPQER